MTTPAPRDESTPPRIAVGADPSNNLELLRTAARLAVDVQLPLVENLDDADQSYDMLLTATPVQLELRVLRGEKELKAGLPVAMDLTELDAQSAAGRDLKQPLLKAIGVKSRKDLGMTILDATAGWGEDAWLLARLGCRVLAVERNKIIATLLKDAIWRAGIAQPEALGRVHVIAADGRHMLRRIARRHEEPPDDLPAALKPFFEPEVVYLDPMYPGHEDRKTAERKPMRVLRALVGGDEDAGELLHWARQVATRRVVVKRPIKAEPLGREEGMEPVEPTMAFEGKGVRYDVYVMKKG